MTTYTAYFRTDAEFAYHASSRPTLPNRRLPSRSSLTRTILDLTFETYEAACRSTRSPSKTLPPTSVLCRQDPDFTLRLAARDLLDALTDLVERFPPGPDHIR